MKPPGQDKFQRNSADGAQTKSVLPASVSQPKKRIGEILIASRLITQTQLEEALSRQNSEGTKVVETLIALGHTTADDFLRVLAKQPGVTSADLTQYEISPDLTALIPRELAFRHEVFPLDRTEKLVTLGMVCPLDSIAIQELQKITGLHIKPLLCSSQDIRAAIARYYSADSPSIPRPQDVESAGGKANGTGGLDTPLRMKSIAVLVREIHSLPLLPQTVQQVQKAMLDPTSSMRSIADIIARDPAIAAKVLSVANSAAYGLSRRVEDISLAVSLLGLREIYSIVLSASILNLVEKTKHFDYCAFRTHSLQCAAAARMLGQARDDDSAVGCFSAGLLHDIGRMALTEVMPDRYARIPTSMHGRQLVEEEERDFGLSHMEAGHELSIRWGLPMGISEPVRFHHRPGLASWGKERVATVTLANLMARAGETDKPDDLFQFPEFEDAQAILKLDADVLRDVHLEFLDVRSAVLDSPL